MVGLVTAVCKCRRHIQGAVNVCMRLGTSRYASRGHRSGGLFSPELQAI